MADDRVAVYLDDARSRYEVFGESDTMPALLAFAEAALALAQKWARFGDGSDAQSECAAELRNALAQALLNSEDG